MKRLNYLFLSLFLLAGCEKTKLDVYPEEDLQPKRGEMIEFVVTDTTATKATGIEPVTNDKFKTFVVSAVSSSTTYPGFSNVSFDFNQSKQVFSSDKYWPAVNPSYSFYASNVQMTSDRKISVTTINKDIVCASLSSSKVSYNKTNTLVFSHILARVGTVNISLPSMCTDVHLSMQYRESGTYNISDGSWSNLGSYKTQTLSISGDNDFWFIPGTYTLTLTYKDGNGTSVTKTQSQKFESGNINNITARLGNNVPIKTETEYEAPTFTLGSINDIPASGGTSSKPSVTNVSQRKRTKTIYANADPEYSQWTTVSNLQYTVTYSTSSTGTFSSTCPTYSANDLKTTAKQRTQFGSVYVRVTANSSYTTKSVEVYQQENKETLGKMEIKFSYAKKNASAGSVTPDFSYSQSYEWTSGSKGNYTTGATVAFSTVTDHSDATLSTTDGKVTWKKNTGSARSEKERVTVTRGGVNYTQDALSEQSGDGVDYYDNPVVTLSYTNSPIAYNSTTAISPTLVVKQTVHYISGSSQTITLSSNEYTVNSYSGSGNTTSLKTDSSTGKVTPSDNSGKTISARDEYDVPKINSFSYDNIAYSGGTSSPSVSYSQKMTSYGSGRESTSSRSTTVTVEVTANGKPATGSATVTQNGDEGKTPSQSSTTLYSGGTLSYSGSATGFTLADNGKVTASDNSGSGGGVSYSDVTVKFSAPSGSNPISYEGGSVTCDAATYSQTKTTAKRNSTSARSISVKVSVNMNGKTSSQTSATCTQNADPGKTASSETITSGYTVQYSSSGTGFSNAGSKLTAGSNAGQSFANYDEVSISGFSYPDKSAEAGSVSPNIGTYSQSKTTGRNSTSSRSGSITASVTMNGKTGTKTLEFTQNGDPGSSSISSCTVKISYSKKSGSTAATLDSSSTGKVSWTENTGTSGRSATITVTASGEGNKSKTMDITTTQLVPDDWDIVVN